MKPLNIIIATLILAFSNCQTSDVEIETPECMDQLIQEFENDVNFCETGKSVYRYVFQNQFVYVFNPGDCGADMMSNVYDEECNLICSLGGIAGIILCNDENFSQGATDETLIWEN
jgi:hypothetical protein